MAVARIGNKVGEAIGRIQFKDLVVVSRCGQIAGPADGAAKGEMSAVRADAERGVSGQVERRQSPVFAQRNTRPGIHRNGAGAEGVQVSGETLLPDFELRPGFQGQIAGFVNRRVPGNFKILCPAQVQCIAYDTLDQLRTGELYRPKIGLYSLVNQWEEEGSKDLAQRAREEVRRILAEYVDTPLPEAVEKEFTQIIKAAENELL